MQWRFGLKGMMLLALLTGTGDALHAVTVSATAKVTVNGAEQFPNGAPEGGVVTINFNGFSETVSYGQFSTSASLASGFAELFTRDYHRNGLYAKAGANANSDPNVITFQLVKNQSFGSVSFLGPSTSFSFTNSGFGGGSSTGPTGTSPLISGLSPNKGAPGVTSVVLTGQSFGTSMGTISFNGISVSPSSWSNTVITVTVPAGATTGPVAVRSTGGLSNSVLFRTTIPLSCPVH